MDTQKPIRALPLILGVVTLIDIILLDQIVKWLVLETVFRPMLEDGAQPIDLITWIMAAPDRLGAVSVPVTEFFNLTMVWNPGVSFGMLQNAGIWPLVMMTIGIAAFLAVWMIRSTSKFEAMALGMIIGGAMGNVIDRFRFGAVADFFDVHAYGYHWPAFNIADAGITIGVVMLILHGLFLSKDQKDRT